MMFSVMMSCYVLDAITASRQHCSRLAVSWSLTAVGRTQMCPREIISDNIDAAKAVVRCPLNPLAAADPQNAPVVGLYW